MKKAILFSMLALTASALSADEELVAAAQKMNGNNKQQEMKKNKEKQDTGMVSLSSARPESDNGWYLFADALYWHADVGNSDWANVSDISSSTFTTSKDRHLSYKWDWGFKAGIGVNMDHDMWDSNISYTWFHTENSQSAGGGTSAVSDIYGVSGGFGLMKTASTKWDLHFSMFDWELGRWNYLSKNLAFRPHAGVKGGWIHQKIHSLFANPNNLSVGGGGNPTIINGITFDEKFKNNFWGVGPSAGINTLWVLGSAGKAMDHRFSLFGDFGGALMYGHFASSNIQKGVDNTGVQKGGVNQKGLSMNRAVTMLQGALGLSWDTAFNKGRNHFMMKVGYELQYWFRQNQFITLAGGGGVSTASNILLRKSDDLALQGVTGEFRFDF